MDKPETPVRRPKGAVSRILPAVYLPAILLYALIAFISHRTGIPAGTFTRDPAQILDAPFYIGFLSNLGFLVWCAGAVAAIFASVLLPRLPSNAETRRFLLWAGLLTLVLCLDDLIMIHDTIAPHIFHLRDQVVYLAYVFGALAFVLRFRRQLLASDRGLLLLAAAFFATSMVLDQWHAFQVIFGRVIFHENHLLEDGAKGLGQVTWMAYLLRRASDALALALQQAAAQRPAVASTSTRSKSAARPS